MQYDHLKFLYTAAASLLSLALVAIPAGQAAAAEPLDCSIEENWKEFHVSTQPFRDDLRPVSVIGAPGGSGNFQGLIAQQANTEDNPIVQISADGELTATGVEAELIALDYGIGAVSFSACTREGFLVLALYYDEDGNVAGAPSDVLGAEFPINYANLTDKSDQRIGVRFNDGGADATLGIIQKALSAIGRPVSFSERVVAENILVNNITNVFDFAESQAPIFNFTEDYCVTEDRFVIHQQDNACSGFANPAISDVVDANGESVMDTASGAVVISPNQVYRAQVQGSEQSRTVLFATAFREEPVVKEELSYTLQSCSLFGCNRSSLPMSATVSSSQQVVPRPEWFNVQEYQLSIESGEFTVSDIEARIVSGPASQARITGLEAKTYVAGDSVSFALQTGGSTSSSRIEFSFNVAEIPASPATFLGDATVQTN